MKILALEKEFKGKTAADFNPFLKEEAQKVWDLHKKGDIREINFRSDEKSAVITLECKDEKEAEQILSTLPLVRENLIWFELIPLAPYSGFERLFKKI